MNSRQKQKALTRSKLVKAGLKLAATKGFSGVSLREVTHEAGITPAAFYRHFNGMEERPFLMPHVLDDKSKENFIANKDLFKDSEMFKDIEKSMNSSYTDLEYKNFIKFLKEFSSRKNIDLSFLPEHFKKWCNL